MALFAVVWHYVDDTALLDRVRPEHRSYLGDLIARGIVRTAGPFTDGSGGILIYEVRDKAELTKLIDDDPFSRNGAIARYDAWEWSPLSGPLAEERT
ncbi:hypothetical protein AU184_26410 [Mycolicibacterium novocastrense]|uniref:YciI family protein n=1 Tax=Mycolicibacterium novocastrense TaxID=59813 RepID=UPI000747D00D|nr:YciI family protein [Mycolicibacterium novocastrense]KUH67484.1 hypothetical protein AU183_00145 [Mycolicibacterium novocastrense]KUH68204.1 hypothetical protein AU184_26410 [Mycolicibacterium novocastrense]KUH74384.1 hypothetical protein AU072_17335 [Mycolicibacterium novocastrense]